MLVADSSLSFDDIIDTTRPARPLRNATPEAARHPFEPVAASGPVNTSTGMVAAAQSRRPSTGAAFPPLRPAAADRISGGDRLSRAEAAVEGRRAQGPHFNEGMFDRPAPEPQPRAASMWPPVAAPEQPAEQPAVEPFAVESFAAESFAAEPVMPEPVSDPSAFLGSHATLETQEHYDHPISTPVGAVSPELAYAEPAFAEPAYAEPDLSASAPGRRRAGQPMSHAAAEEPRPATVTALPTHTAVDEPESEVSASVTPLPTREYVQSHSHNSHPVPTVAEPEEEFYDATVARPPGVVRGNAPVDGKFTVRAFRALPTLWQHVLWMTSVEERTTAETAARLQLSRGVTAAAILHAREGLRHEWLSALLNERDLAISCSSVIQYMHAYACDVATSAETELIEQHLHRCVRCTTITDEFARFPERLPYILVPLAESGVDVFNPGPESVEAAVETKEATGRRSGGRHRA